ncbi:MAG: hypothetical protein VSS75_026525 [Candidatus Parabeggiatoa sp.]|nr:hypothetical protein [Candidatus Parabeggiatoa sp.]
MALDSDFYSFIINGLSAAAIYNAMHCEKNGCSSCLNGCRDGPVFNDCGRLYGHAHSALCVRLFAKIDADF